MKVHDIVQKAVTKTISKKNAQRQSDWRRRLYKYLRKEREVKSKGEWERYIEFRVSENSKKR